MFPTHEEFIWFVTLGMASIIGGFFWFNARRTEKRFTEIEKKATEIESNYRDEFKSVREAINSTEKKILDRIGDIRVTLAKDYVQKSDCPFIHKQLSTTVSPSP